ncbi:unnamed protein product [Rotaria sp. Silwood2]|nr:unnamed protein product [Rotaria sp. Silwood2]CAF3962803.1 unnamed protein product [Rotaria sp. Silwood2]CAF3995481.1 unnamed protein product [Rotaria sp. Silwood2]
MLFSAPIQQQQQQQQQVTILDSSVSPQSICMLNEETFAPQTPQMIHSSWAPTTTSLFSRPGNVINTNNVYPMFSGLNVPVGYQTTTDTTITTTATLPPPSHTSPLAFNPFTSSITTNASFGSQVLNVSTIPSTFGFQSSAPFSASHAFTFGSNVNYNSNSMNATFAPKEYDGSAIFSAVPSQLPPRPSFLAPPPPPPPPPPPTTTTGALPFSSTSSESQLLFSFGGSGESMEMLSDVDKIRTESYEPCSTVEENESIYPGRTVEQSSKLHNKMGFRTLTSQKSKQHKFSDIANQLKSASEAKHVIHKASESWGRYTDTRCDEQTVMPIVRSSSREFACELSAKTDSMLLKKMKGKPKSAHKTDEECVLLLDVTPLSLGIEDINGHMCIIIRRNTTMPFRTQFYPVFTNAYAYQTTASIRVFSGEHKLTKYNIFLGEFTLTGLTPNFASQTLEISIVMDIDCNGFVQVEAEESRSGAKTKFVINSKNDYLHNTNDIERHLSYVESNPDFRAACVHDRGPNDSLYMLKGETTNEKVNFTDEPEHFQGFSTFNKLKQIDLTSMMINELKRIQLTNGSFDLNQDLANLLSLSMRDFDELKIYLNKQGFSSFALNIQNDIIHLIATGIILLELLLQVPVSERNIFLVPFDSEQIRSILYRHLPKTLLENVDKVIHFYEQKRLCYGIYCEQLELNYSSWEKFIQYALFHINN